MAKSSLLYQKIYEDVRASIEMGTYKPGDKIPSEQELCAEFGASRITVRRAIEELCNNGFLIKHQGVGTFVSKTRFSRQLRRTGNGLVSFTQLCREQGLEPGARLVDRQIVPIRGDERRFFGLGAEALLLYVRRVRTADDVPIYEENIFLPYDEFRGVMSAALDDVSIFDAIEREGGRRPVANSHLTLEAVSASQEQASLLQVPAKAPLLYMNAFFVDKDGRPIAIGRQYYVGSHYAFDV
uniref:GntR family transcriptional regulator n=1 Tax=Parolsenella massiliensis TaxID=1871022 RepID=UPI0012FF475B|nr:GntR family transcriptional regulator [Parolsenella massiliensis]